MGSIQLTDKVLTESENKQIQSTLKRVVHFMSVQAFYSDFVKGQQSLAVCIKTQLSCRTMKGPPWKTCYSSWHAAVMFSQYLHE